MALFHLSVTQTKRSAGPVSYTHLALIGYIWYEAPEDEKNFTTLLEMINASEAR